MSEKDKDRHKSDTFDAIDELIDRNGRVPFPAAFGSDGNALALVASATTALRTSGWPKEDIKSFKSLALSGDYNMVINSCLHVFERKPESEDT